MKAFTVALFTVILAALFSVAADQSQPPKEDVNFKRLADSSHAVVQKYGSIMEYNGTILAARNTFLIDPAGLIKRCI